MVQRRNRSRRRSDSFQRLPGEPAAAVLFVDDDPLVGKAFVRSVANQKLEVVTLTDPNAALDAVRAQRFKVVVTDLRMPGIDGLSLIEKLRRLQPDLVFIIVTAIPELDLRRSTETEASILGTLPKPWDVAELSQMVRTAVELYDRRAQAAVALPPGGVRLLLVEDNPGDAELFVDILDGETDVCTEVVTRVSQAEVLLARQRFDVVVTDLSLPDARGLDAIRRLRRAAPGAALMVLSGLCDEDVARQAMRLGAQEFLLKDSYDARTLRHRVDLAMEREAYVDKLVGLAHYDQLTGLANRRTLHERFGRARAMSRESGGTFGLLSLDLDRFKSINDTLGHAAGDALLQEVARRITSCVRPHDTPARLGGDEFGVLLTDLAAPEEAMIVAERLSHAMEAPVVLEHASVKVTMSIGVVVPDSPDASIDDLLRAADETMYVAKRSGRDRIVTGGTLQSRQSRERLALESELRDAVQERRLTLAYQPQYRLDGGELAGFEALMRWTRLDGTIVSPALFVPLLEEFELIGELGPWLLDTACAELVRWRASSEAPRARMAVNISGQQFERPGLVEEVQVALLRHGLEPEALELEITENVLMRDTTQTARALCELRELGVRVAIDDFGTGYSSLAYLQRFQVTTLKVDRCFVAALDDARTACIASAVVGLGQRLEMEIVAEGVETEEQLQRLRREGCDLAQGFYLSRPVADTAQLRARYALTG